MKKLAALLFLIAFALHAAGEPPAFQPAPMSLSGDKPTETGEPQLQLPLNPLLAPPPFLDPPKIQAAGPAVVVTDKQLLKKAFEQPVLQVRQLTTIGGDSGPDRLYYEVSVSSSMGTFPFLWINAVTGTRKLPYESEDTYLGPSSVEETVPRPKSVMRIKVDGEWSDLPALREPVGPGPDGILRIPFFRSLPLNEEVKLGGFWLPRGKKLEEMQVDLTEMLEPGKGEILTRTWTSQ